MSFSRGQLRYMNPYDIHKAIINDYVLRKSGDTSFLRRDTSKDKTDFDVVKENHKFLWDDAVPETWEQQFAKKYYDKLFKEYCIGDLSRYKENKIALRWRIEQEVITGKGQFICGNKRCTEKLDLRTWEVNFSYMEHGEKKNALVKIRLCPQCSKKLNYHFKRREIKRSKKRKREHSKSTKNQEKKPSTSLASTSISEDSANDEDKDKTDDDKVSPWENLKPVESKSREEEMEDYLEDLLL